ncbi:MAG: CpsB/CapC family capsule biosynthesis tyrosine phosphatase [Reichenbachiella sp.]|uniref:tyrosine-protein phosphatase n=1 Tax=Reichenbachiella sp. TaxID=2184521 RepID=UPI0032670F76
MFNLFKTKGNFLETDLHSHLIPNIDDGVSNWEDAVEILSQLCKLGYKKVITTPHIILGYYPNTPDIIREGVVRLNQMLEDSDIPILVEPGAEYFVDEKFYEMVKAGEELLTFGDQYILIETPFMNKPFYLEDVIFDLQARGFKPILAHPERYSYLQNDFQIIHKLADSGVLFQVNINSLEGYYSSQAKKIAQRLIDNQLVHFLGSDIHNQKHMNQMRKTVKSKLFQKCRQLDLLNSTL